jgi:hypothetical protein
MYGFVPDFVEDIALLKLSASPVVHQLVNSFEVAEWIVLAHQI